MSPGQLTVECICFGVPFQWLRAGGQGTQAAPPKNQQAENGKTEMSLMHFHVSHSGLGCVNRTRWTGTGKEQN